MLKKLSGSQGFSLVEAVVVGIIIAVLAAVAIPIYNGFLADSQLDAAYTTCEMIASAATFAHSRGLAGISNKDWDALGISDPDKDSDLWTYSFDAIPAINASLQDADFKVTATPTGKCKISATYYLRPQPGTDQERWGTDGGS